MRKKATKRKTNVAKKVVTSPKKRVALKTKALPTSKNAHEEPRRNPKSFSKKELLIS